MICIFMTHSITRFRTIESISLALDGAERGKENKTICTPGMAGFTGEGGFHRSEQAKEDSSEVFSEHNLVREQEEKQLN